MASDEGKSQLSQEARDLDDHTRELVSDLTDFDVRKPTRTRFTALWIVLFLVAISVLLLLINRPAPLSSDTPTTDQIAAGPVSGTWDMYATGLGSESERKIFTIRFVGDETGTVEVLEDETAHDTSYEIDGDSISFQFTRLFDTVGGDWPEQSTFTGTISEDVMTGEWARQDWECRPEREPPCEHGPEPARYESRLVRQP